MEWPYSDEATFDRQWYYKLADSNSGPIAGISTIYIVPDAYSDANSADYAIDIYNPAGKLSRHLTGLSSDGDTLSQAWKTADFGECNGAYRVVVTKSVAGGGTITHESTFNVSNLVITSTSVSNAPAGDTSGVLRYDPDDPAPLTITVKADAAYQTTLLLAWATLYSADHKTVIETNPQYLVNILGAAGTATLTLNASEMLAGSAPKGIYFYCVHACVTGPSIITSRNMDFDDDKTIAPVQWIADLKMNPTGDDGTTATYDALYKVTGSEKPLDAHLDYYDSDLKLQKSWPVHPDTDPIDPDTGDRKISLQIPSDTPGTLAFQTHTGPSLSNKNYPQRPALPRGKPNVFSYVVGFYHDSMTEDVYDEPRLLKKAFQYFNVSRDFNIPDGATQYEQRSLGGIYDPNPDEAKSAPTARFHALPDLLPDGDTGHDAWYFQGDGLGRSAAVTVGGMEQALLHASSLTNEGQQRRLKVAMFAGHGGDLGGTLRLRGARHDSDPIVLFVPSSTYHNDSTKVDFINPTDKPTGYPINLYPALELDDMLTANATRHGVKNVDKSKLLDNLDLVILVGCTVGQPGNNPNAEKLLELGAKCIVRAGIDKSFPGPESVFLTFFTGALRQKQLSIFDAARYASTAGAKWMSRAAAGSYGDHGLDYEVKGPGAGNILKAE